MALFFGIALTSGAARLGKNSMETEQQLKVYRQTINALNAQNERLKQELQSALEELESLKEIISLPENAYKLAYKDMKEYCRMAKESYEQAENYRKEMIVMKAKYIKELQDTVNSLI